MKPLPTNIDWSVITQVNPLFAINVTIAPKDNNVLTAIGVPVSRAEELQQELKDNYRLIAKQTGTTLFSTELYLKVASMTANTPNELIYIAFAQGVKYHEESLDQDGGDYAGDNIIQRLI